MVENTALFVSDLHGIRYGYDRVFDIAISKGINTILIGGDITPKRVAIKLKGYFDALENEDVAGEIIPLFVRDSLDLDEVIEDLLRVKKLNEKFSEEELEKNEINLGNIIYEPEKTHYSLDSMIIEYQVLNKLEKFFSQDLGKIVMPDMGFTEDELFFLDDLMMDLRGKEREYPDRQKENMVRAWEKSILKSRRAYTFEDLAPSKNIPIFARYGRDRTDIFRLEKELGEFLKDKGRIGREILRRTKSFKDEVERAVSLISSYDATLLASLKADTEFKTVESLATDNQVYVEGQKEFINIYLREKLEEYKRVNPEGQVYLIMGNDDRTEVVEEVRRLDDEGLLTFLDSSTENVVELSNDLFLAGYPHVRPSGRYYDGWEKTEEEIARDFEELARQSDPRRTIYLCHSPPFDGALDIAYNGEHIGSKAIAAFVSVHKPLGILSGHAHDSYKKSGQVMELRKGTYCFNVGGDHNAEKVRALIVNLDDLSDHEVVEKC